MALFVKAGMAAYSTAGRDRGKAYVIIKAEGARVWLSDGKLRDITRPKVKNIKHIQPVRQPVFSEEELPGITDTEIRKRIGALKERIIEETKECQKQM